MTFHYQLHGADLHDAKAHSGSGSPVGVITPDVVGLLYFDTVANQLWTSTGLTNTDWVVVSDATPGESVFTNGEVVPLGKGAPVYIFGAGTVKKAFAGGGAAFDAIGLVADAAIGVSAAGNVITNGRLVATTAQWDAVTGLVGGLIPATRYYLSASTAGRITATPPQSDTDVGKYVVRLGTAVDATTFELRIERAILL